MIACWSMNWAWSLRSFPILLIIALLLRPSRQMLRYTLLYFGCTFASFAHLNILYLRQATPWSKVWWVPVMQLIFPLQLSIALLSPQRINWRGNIVQVERWQAAPILRVSVPWSDVL